MKKLPTHSPRILRIIEAVGGVVALSLLLYGCAPTADVIIAAPALKLDKTNSVVTQLVAALPKNPQANTFVVNWNIVPDPTRAGEAIPHSIIYDRKAKTLAFYRDTPQYDLYSGVTDARLKAVTTKGESLPALTQQGCTMKIQDPRTAN